MRSPGLDKHISHGTVTVFGNRNSLLSVSTAVLE